jgi:hypothetical protein
MMSCSNFNQERGSAIDDSGRLQEVPRAVPIQMSAVGESLNRNTSKTPILPNPFSQREPPPCNGNRAFRRRYSEPKGNM